ncbi:MAG: hypothetical protein J6D57_14780 [Mogibacterium sp.]|nr:hypothetical protein [Mogibacterium sp.]
MAIIEVYLFLSAAVAYAHAQATEKRSDDAMIEHPLITTVFMPGVLLGRYLRERLHKE